MATIAAAVVLGAVAAGGSAYLPSEHQAPRLAAPRDIVPGYGGPVSDQSSGRLPALETAIPVEGGAAGQATPPRRVPGSFIVALAPGQDPKAVATTIARDYGGEVGAVYDHVIGGFRFQGPDDAGPKMATDPRVRSVQPDYQIGLAETTAATHLKADDAPCVTSGSITCPASWPYTLPYKGDNVQIGILDTGADFSHPDIQNNLNAALSTDASSGVCNTQNGSAQDQNGHGTRTTSNAVGLIGVAPHAKVVMVKVFSGSSSSTTFSTIACGVNYLVGLNKTGDPSKMVSAVNASIAGSGSAGSCTDGGLRQAICQLVDGTDQFASDNVTPVGPPKWSRAAFFAAAGNTGGSASGIVPASYPETIAVSAFDCDSIDCTTATPKLASFSSRGSVIAIGAPGVNIYSAKLGGGHETASGTSRSSPQATGAAADLLSAGIPVAQIRSALQTGGMCPMSDRTKNSAGNCVTGTWPGDGDGFTEPFLDVGFSISGAGPTGSFLSPANGSTLRQAGNVTFQVAATTTNATISSVQIAIPSAGFSSASAFQPSPGCGCWQSSSAWNSSNASDGSYVVNATITDSSNRQSTVSETLTVDNTDNPPTVTWVTPAAGATIGQTFNVQANVTDDNFPGDTNPPTATLFLDGTSQGGPTAANYTWTLTNVPVGSHTLRVDASDGHNTGSSGDRQVTVSAVQYFYGPQTFDTSPAANWSTSGCCTNVKWHLANLSCGANSTNAEPTGFGAYYGRTDTSCTYRTGSSNSGTLFSPSVTVPVSSYQVSFLADRSVDSCAGCTRDQTYVDVNFQDGTGWHRSYYADAGHQPSSPNHACTTPTGAGFQSITCSFSNASGKVQVRFGFKTTTSIDASPQFGWAIDDFSVHS